jgi:hypothetical protein|tara:strand:+ start:614 stop:847 length:234 start_codon:yes stop_codon:yes gene_type:complete
MKDYKTVSTMFRLTTRTGRKPFDIDESQEYENLSEADQSVTYFEQVWRKGESWTLEVMRLSSGKPEDNWVTIDYSSY